MATLEQRESTLLNFIDEVNKQRLSDKANDQWKENPTYKLREIGKQKEEAKEICLDSILSKIYRNALPLDDEYKCAHSTELDAEFPKFIKHGYPNGTKLYVSEAIRRGSIPAARMMESVDNYIRDIYFEAEMNVNNENSPKVEFDPNSSETQQRLDEINSEMDFDQISEIIRDNVKQASQNEIQKVKDEEERIKALEDELSDNPDINTESAIEFELEKRGMGGKKVYKPSLFNGIMINKLNLVKESFPDVDARHQQELAFVESVKEFTKWSVLEALKMEKFTPAFTDKLANDYATMNR